MAQSDLLLAMEAEEGADRIPQAFDDLLPGPRLHALADQQQTQGSESG